jgi:hypothetical protein
MGTRHSAVASLRRSLSVAIFSLTLFVSAALLFLMEPMFAKITLPVLGGTTAVWTTCMLFYQAILLAVGARRGDGSARFSAVVSGMISFAFQYRLWCRELTIPRRRRNRDQSRHLCVLLFG